MGDNRVIALMSVAFSLLISWASLTLAAEPVQLSCAVKGQGNVEIEIKISHPGITGLILKATLPKGVKLVSAKPEAKGVKDGIVKWFIDARSRQKISVQAKLSKEISESEISIEAIFKMPGTQGMKSVKAR